MKSAKPFWSLILLLAIVKFFLPFVLQSSAFELQRDEFLYYQQGQHFAIGYLENPPLLSWLATVSSWVGGTEFWIKCWPALFGSLTVIITCLLTAEFGGRGFAQFIAGLGMMLGAFMRVHALFQPNILDIFFWTLAIYYIVRYVNTRSDKYLFWFTISLALGFWSKYSVLFIGAALLISLLLTQHRDIFSKRNFYLAVGVAILLILPNVWWQYNHRWPLIHHMQELQETQLQYLKPTDFIKDQLLMLFPVLLIWIGGVIWLLRQSQWRFLAFSFLLVLILLIAGRGKSYYALGIYPMLIAAGGSCWEKISTNKIWIRWSLTILGIGLTVPFVPLLLPIWKPERLARFYQSAGFAKTGALRWEDQQDHSLPQDFADMLGWKELSNKAESFYLSLPDSIKQQTIVYCRNYGQAGALKFYARTNEFRDRVISDNGTFLLWIADSLYFNHLVLIGREIPDKEDEVFQHFGSVSIIDSVSNPYSRQFGDKIIIFKDADPLAYRIARDGLNELKQEYRR